MSQSEEVNQILSSIFTFPIKSNPSFALLLSSKEVSKLILFLKDENKSLEQKIKIINLLINIFQYNGNLIHPLINNCLIKAKYCNILQPLIDLYISPQIKDDNEALIEKLIKIIKEHTTMMRSTFEYVYQKLSLYFANKNKEILDENLLVKYLKVLNILYSENSLPNEVSIEKEIKNYIYFNGQNSALFFKLNDKITNLNTDFPTLENGFSIVFWCYIKKDLMTKFYELDEKNKFKLVEIKIGGHKINLVFDDINNLKVILDDNDSSIINVKSCFKFDSWNNICFMINPKSAFKLDINIVINGKTNNSFLPITKEFQISDKINDILLFKNFLGLVTSVLFFSFELNSKQIQYFTTLKYGFNKNKILYEFFLKNSKDYLSNGVNQHKYSKQIKVDKYLNLFDFSLKKQNIKNLICFLCPFNYNKEQNLINDIFGNFCGILTENDGINNYKNNTKSIKKIGGMNNLLPLIELIYSSNSRAKNIKYDNINKNILSEKTFLLYFKILNTTLVKKPKNIIDANLRRFFPSLSIFLEKFPSKVFTSEILKIFINIGKEAFESNYNNTNDTFINNILINEKIVIKFSQENQIILWDNLYQLFSKNDTKLKGALTMNKICMLLRFYDDKRYNEFCCDKHANLFKPNENNTDYKPNIMKKSINTKVDKLFGIIQIYIEKIADEEEIADFYKLLLMDLSPCLKIKIIESFQQYFFKEHIPIHDRKKILENLLKNNMLEISQYILIISLLDVKIEILKLFYLFIDNKDLSEVYYKYLNNMKGDNGLNNIHIFFADNLLPDKLIINSTEKEPQKLTKYFNTEIYTKDLDELWSNLTQWLIVKSTNATPQKNEKNIKPNIHISEFMIDYCLLFVSKSPEKYIDLFLKIAFSLFEDQTISNRTIVYENEHIYPWVIETIFYFYNKENEINIKDKKVLESIKSKSLDFFCEFFSHRRPGDEFMKRVNYIMQYSYKLKEILKEDEKKIAENSRITRILFKKLLEKAPKKINEVINLCFEFMILYKNSQKSEEIIKNIPEDLKSLVINIMHINMDLGKKIENKLSYINYGLMPKYIYEGLYYNVIEKGKKATLKEIWKDSALYDSIIDYYMANLWGMEYLCKKVKVEYTGDPLKISKQILKEYADNKSYKNILKEDVIKYFNIKLLEQKDGSFKIIEDEMINIFNINLILLCVAIELSLDEEERNFISGLFQQFLIYCIMVSVNISPQEKCHDYIQEKIYFALGYGALFLSRVNRKKYDEVCDEVLSPILEEVNSENSKKKIKTIFSGKKNMFTNTAIVKLFEGNEIKYFNDKKTPNKKEKDDKRTASSNIDTKLNVLFKGEISKILKNVFEADLFAQNIKDKENKSKNDIEIFYKNLYNVRGIYDMQNDEEKNRVLKKVLKLISFYETQIKNYSNSSALKEKIKRNSYKWTKKRLFSWRGFWSDRELFFNHPENLKLKQKNHITKEMTMPLLCPVLDMDYYLPDFSKFESKNLFNNKNINYKISLDIDDVLRDELDEKIEKEKINLENNDNKINITFDKNVYNNFNYLESIYKYNFDKIWEKYLSYYEENFDFNKIILKNKKAFDMFLSSKTIAKTEEDRRIENQYNCCIVKQTHHVKGYISTEKKQVRFFFDAESRKYDTNETLENDPTYDRDMDCCFGSTFKTNKADKDKINFKIEYKNIKYMFLRYYFYIQSGLEIYTNKNKVYFLNFKTNRDLLSFTKDVLNHSNDKFAFREIKAEDYKGKKLIGYELYKLNKTKDAKEYLISSKMNEWQTRSISTLEYLMWLNIYSGRSFQDLTQYPVFPWLITNYDKNEIDPQNDYRNLGLSMGMLTISEKGEARKETFCDTYEMVKNDLKEMFPDFNYSEFLKKQDDYYELYRNKTKKKVDNKNTDENKLDVNHLPYFYGSHYSNPTYISHYLSRSFPSAFVAIEIQGEKFDDPDRLFFSMNKTFISASSLKDDVRELIPEFYTTPEIFLNQNNLNLSQGKISSDNKKYEINDVELPPWCNNNACNFVSQNRRILESSNIKSLNKWIDLIFGSAQRGEKAEENNNIFKAQSYERMVKIDDITDPDSRNALMRLIEIGVTPLQIFSVDSKTKYDKKQFLEKSPIYQNNKGNFVYEEKELATKIIKLINFKNIKKKLYENEKLSKNKLYTLDKNDFSMIKIIKMKQIENNNIRIFTNTNQWFNIKIYPNYKDLSPEESPLYDVENNSSKFANSYLLNSIEYPLIIYDNWKYLLKGGFLDGRMEFNILSYEQKEEIISSSIFNDFGCITIMEIAEKENYLLCGTKDGGLLSFQIDKYDKYEIELKNNLIIHTAPIISISINDNLNMFATSSKDGYIMLYTFPSFNLIRSIYVPFLFKDEAEFNYADKIFLSNYPLPCFSIYIAKKKIFKTFTINGHYMNDIKEEENIQYIKNDIVFTSFDYQDYLIYSTNDGLIKLRKFPELNLINSINPFNNGKPIKCLCLSKDKRFIFCWSESNEIGVISNNFNK